MPAAAEKKTFFATLGELVTARSELVVLRQQRAIVSMAEEVTQAPKQALSVIEEKMTSLRATFKRKV